jgi:hypothetical protein
MASNMVTGDNNNRADIFLREVAALRNHPVTFNPPFRLRGVGKCAISGNGLWVAYEATPQGSPGVTQILMWHRDTHETLLVSRTPAGGLGNGNSREPQVSSSRYVTFWSAASNLVTGDTNRYEDAFVFDLSTKKVERVSVSSMGTDLVPAGPVAISVDARYIAFAATTGVRPAAIGDYNLVYLRDRLLKSTVLVSRTDAGAPADNDSVSCSVSQFGRFVAFDSLARNLATPDSGKYWDVFVRGPMTTARVSQTAAGQEGNGHSRHPVISDDGRFVAFESSATNLIPKVGGKQHIFLNGTSVPTRPKQPDLLVWVGESIGWIFGDIYDDPPVQQVTNVMANAGVDVVHEMRVENDGQQAGHIAIKGPGEVQGWKVSYFNRRRGGQNVTRLVTGRTGWQLGKMQPQDAREFRVVVHISGMAPPGASRTVDVKAEWQGMSSPPHDIVRFVAQVAKKTTATACQVAGLTATPTAAGAAINFTLAAAAEVDARVLNLAGRPVRTLARGAALGSGANVLLWDARDQQGLRVPDGVYLVDLTARSPSGERSHALTQVRLAR